MSDQPTTHVSTQRRTFWEAMAEWFPWLGQPWHPARTRGLEAATSRIDTHRACDGGAVAWIEGTDFGRCQRCRQPLLHQPLPMTSEETPDA